MSLINSTIQSSAPEDRVGSNQTIYDASLSAVFWRNFLAGMARALGGIIMQIIFMIAVALVIINLLLPKLAPVITTYEKAINSLDSLQKTTQKFSLPDESGQPAEPASNGFVLDEQSLNQLFESLGGESKSN